MSHALTVCRSDSELGSRFQKGAARSMFLVPDISIMSTMEEV